MGFGGGQNRLGRHAKGEVAQHAQGAAATLPEAEHALAFSAGPKESDAAFRDLARQLQPQHIAVKRDRPNQVGHRKMRLVNTGNRSAEIVCHALRLAHGLDAG